jgi:hypothetical protein
MIRYFATLSLSRAVLWCYLSWYIAVSSLYFQPSPALWISSLGMSAIIGTALVLSTSSTNAKRENWAVFRLYLMPFCVSSYSALTVGKGFLLIFPPRLPDNAIAFGACGTFLILRYCCLLIAGPK